MPAAHKQCGNGRGGSSQAVTAKPRGARSDRRHAVHPAALDDAARAYRWMLDRGVAGAEWRRRLVLPRG